MRPLPKCTDTCQPGPSGYRAIVPPVSGFSFKRSSKKSKGSNTKAKKEETFQKKLVVFRFMGQNMPVFTRNDSNIVARGLLPEIPLIASEEDVRKEITSALKSSFSYVTVRILSL